MKLYLSLLIPLISVNLFVIIELSLLYENKKPLNEDVIKKKYQPRFKSNKKLLLYYLTPLFLLFLIAILSGKTSAVTLLFFGILIITITITKIILNKFLYNTTKLFTIDRNIPKISDDDNYIQKSIDDNDIIISNSQRYLGFKKYSNINWEKIKEKEDKNAKQNKLYVKSFVPINFNNYKFKIPLGKYFTNRIIKVICSFIPLIGLAIFLKFEKKTRKLTMIFLGIMFIIILTTVIVNNGKWKKNVISSFSMYKNPKDLYLYQDYLLFHYLKNEFEIIDNNKNYKKALEIFKNFQNNNLLLDSNISNSKANNSETNNSETNNSETNNSETNNSKTNNSEDNSSETNNSNEKFKKTNSNKYKIIYHKEGNINLTLQNEIIILDNCFLKIEDNVTFSQDTKFILLNGSTITFGGDITLYYPYEEMHFIYDLDEYTTSPITYTSNVELGYNPNSTSSTTPTPTTTSTPSTSTPSTSTTPTSEAYDDNDYKKYFKQGGNDNPGWNILNLEGNSTDNEGYSIATINYNQHNDLNKGKSKKNKTKELVTIIVIIILIIILLIITVRYGGFVTFNFH